MNKEQNLSKRCVTCIEWQSHIVMLNGEHLKIAVRIQHIHNYMPLPCSSMLMNRNEVRSTFHRKKVRVNLLSLSFMMCSKITLQEGGPSLFLYLTLL